MLAYSPSDDSGAADVSGVLDVPAATACFDSSNLKDWRLSKENHHTDLR